jgi:hypothetical protein
MLHLRHDCLDEHPELLTLRLRIAASVPHDHTAIAQLHQASEIIDNLLLGPGARISAAVRACSRLANVEKELMAQAEVGKASPVRLAQLLERG